MEISSEAKAILQTFIDRGCGTKDVISFDDLGDVLVWENGFLKEGPKRDAFIFLCENDLIVEHNSGIGITAAGIAAV